MSQVRSYFLVDIIIVMRTCPIEWKLTLISAINKMLKIVSPLIGIYFYKNHQEIY